MRKESLVSDEYYHIYNRGVDKRDIFSDKEDVRRFAESISGFNQIDGVGSIRDLRKSESKALSNLSKEPLVAVVAYCLNPNHFHFLIKQLVDGGVSKFMQKLQGGYTYYFNKKYFRSGALFQGTFKSHLLDDENYFNKTLGYVNKNYAVHTIPKNKQSFIFSSDYEYENNNFKIVSKQEAERILNFFNGNHNFKKHCDEVVEIIKQERKGEISLLEEDNLPNENRV